MVYRIRPVVCKYCHEDIPVIPAPIWDKNAWGNFCNPICLEKFKLGKKEK